MYSHANPCVSVLQGLSAAPGKILWGGMNFLEPLCGSGASYWSQWGLRITSWNSWVFHSQILGQEQCVFPDQLLEHRIRWISEGPMLVNGSGPQVTSHVLGASCWDSIRICLEPDMHGVCICIYCQTSHWTIQWVWMGESIWNLGRLLGRQKDVTVLKHTQAGCWVWRCLIASGIPGTTGLGWALVDRQKQHWAGVAGGGSITLSLIRCGELKHTDGYGKLLSLSHFIIIFF